MATETSTDRSIFLEAVESVSQERWDTFIHDRCGDDAVLYDRVRRLLHAHRDLGDFQERTPVATVAATFDTPPPEAIGTMVGPYKLGEQIGEGGMGVVYLAEQLQPVRRKVALKIIKPGMDTKQVIARFEAERQTLAMMDHPHVAKVLDAGSTDSGRPYFVMDLVCGLPITQYCDQHHFTTQDRLALFVKVCYAVRHAHEQGIVHRDIKPSNVMIMLRDGKPVPKVIDFGIAKATNQRLIEHSVATTQGQLIGTPQYMSPEQADFASTDVDARSDVYSLGVLLYELLVGTTPFRPDDLRDIGFDRVCQIFRETDPPAPSKRLSTLGNSMTTVIQCRRTRPAELSRQLRGDLDVIVMKALEKDRKDRYGSVGELAEDIGRYLRHEPILARRPTLTTRVSKWARRHRTFVWTAAATLLVAVVTLSTSTVVIAHALRQSRSALAQTKLERQKALTARSEAEQERDEAVKNLYVAQMRLAQKDWTDGQVLRLKKTLLSYLPASGQTDLRGWEWYYNLSRCHADLLTWRGHGGGSVFVAWSPDGEHLASRTYQEMKVWNPETGNVVETVRDGAGWEGMAWRPDGKQIALTSSHGDDVNQIKIWDMTQKRMQLAIEVDRHLVSLAWSPDGAQIAAPGPDKTVMIWDAETGTTQRRLLGHDAAVVDVAWSPNGKYLAASGFKTGTITIWELESEKPTRTIESGRTVVELAWSPDSSQLGAGTESGEVLIWEVAGPESVLAYAEKGPVTTLAWKFDGSQIATGSSGNSVLLRDADTGNVLRKLQGHTGILNSLSWSPDGARLASGARDGTVKIWDALQDQVVRVIAEDAEVKKKAAFSPDDRCLAYIATGQVIKVVDTGTGAELRTLPRPPGRIHSPIWSPDGKYLACGGYDGAVVTYDVEQGKLASRWQHSFVPLKVRKADPYWSIAVSWHPESGQLASVSEADPFIQIWDAATGSKLDTIDTKPSRNVSGVFHQAVAWSPDGERLAVTSQWGKRIEIWDRARQRRLHVMKGSSRHLAWSRDGRYLASGGNYVDPVVTIWDTFTGRASQTFKTHTGWVDVAGWTDDGRRIATVGYDGVRIWDPQTGRELFSLPDAKIMSWSHDRRQIATISDGIIRIHDASIGYDVASDPSYRSQAAQALIPTAFSLARDAHYQEALKQMEAALRFAPHDTEVQLRAAWLLTTISNERLRDPNRALELARSATEALPKSAGAWQVLGWAQYRQGEWHRSIDVLQKSVQLQGDNGDPWQWFFLAMAQWRIGEKQEAQRYFTRALAWMEKNDPRNTELLRFRAEAAEVLGINQDEEEQQEGTEHN